MYASASAATSFSLLLCHDLPLSQHRRRKFLINSPPITFLSRHSLTNPTRRISAAISEIKSFNVSCSFLDNPAIDDDFGGWASPETPIPPKKQGFPTFLIAGVGTSIALLVAAIAHFSLSKSGFRLPFRSSVTGLSMQVASEEDMDIDTTADSELPNEESASSETIVVDSSDVVAESVTSGKHQPRIVTVAVDSNQHEALHMLKKLKIIDEDVKADQLCTRREYARWLVRASSLLERNPKYKVTAAAALSGSVISAYKDVTVGDQDFDSIQALAEAGVVTSKLSSQLNLANGGIQFSPDRFLSRLDLIDWRAQLEYDFAVTRNHELDSLTVQILKTKLDLMDVREISSDERPGLLMDMLAGDKSLLRRVFGKIRRLQPNKPSTVAQVAVALTSGRMMEAIHTELLRIESEESSRQAAKEEIRYELLDRGEIQRYWAEKMEEEKARGLEVQELYINACKELEQEKTIPEDVFNGYLKEKAAMDCQKQLLNCLKEEVREMSERLVSERSQQIAEEEATQTLRSDLEIKKEGILDAKSLLEAEIEALRILRSWIEDEARKSQARSKVLEEVGRRWKWDGQF